MCTSLWNLFLFRVQLYCMRVPLYVVCLLVQSVHGVPVPHQLVCAWQSHRFMIVPVWGVGICVVCRGIALVSSRLGPALGLAACHRSKPFLVVFASAVWSLSMLYCVTLLSMYMYSTQVTYSYQSLGTCALHPRCCSFVFRFNPVFFLCVSCVLGCI